MGKINAVHKALKFVKEGSIIGLGSGTTMTLFVEELVKSGLNVKGVSTSEQIAKIARENGIELVESIADIAFDGADQIDSDRNILKGQGALAFLKEKEVDYSAKQCVIIVDDSKLSDKLDKEVLVAVENESAREKIKEKYNVVKEKEGILFLNFGDIENAAVLEKELDSIEGVLGNGIFANFKREPIIIVGDSEGGRIL